MENYIFMSCLKCGQTFKGSYVKLIELTNHLKDCLTTESVLVESNQDMQIFANRIRGNQTYYVECEHCNMKIGAKYLNKLIQLCETHQCLKMDNILRDYEDIQEESDAVESIMDDYRMENN